MGVPADVEFMGDLLADLHCSRTFLTLVPKPSPLTSLTFLFLPFYTVVDITLASTSHAKGQLLLCAILTSLFLHKFQLFLNARYRFLQSYGEVKVDVLTTFGFGEFSVFLEEGIVSCEGVKLLAIVIIVVVFMMLFFGE